MRSLPGGPGLLKEGRRATGRAGHDEVGRGAWHGRVKLGMAGQAEIVTERESLLRLLLRRIRQSMSLG